MNGFLLTTGLQHEYLHNRLSAKYKTTYQSIETITNENSPYFCLTILKDNEKVSGFHEDNRCICILSGYLQYPLCNWEGSPPVDSGNYAAAYLLKQYYLGGNDFLAGVNGRFVVLIIEKNGNILIQTDNEGNRRVYYKKDKVYCQVATNLKWLYSDEEKNIKLPETAFFLSYGFLTNEKTIYPNVCSLSSTTTLTISDGKNLLLIDKPVPSGNSKTTIIDNEEEAIESLYIEFMAAIKRQLPSENKLAVLLGGFDSALIAAALVHMGKEVETFTFRFADPAYNQNHVEELAYQLGIKHTWVDITPEVMLKGLEEYPSLFNQPSDMAHYLIQTNHVFGQIRKEGFNYCFTGDGCDDLFIGYPTVYRRVKIFLWFKNLPTGLLRSIRKALTHTFIDDHLGYAGRMARNILLALSRKMPARGFVAHRIFDEYTLQRLSTVFPLSLEKNVEQNLEVLAEKHAPLTPVRLAFKGKAMVGSGRLKVEGSAMCNGIVIQSPYWDMQLRAFASRLDDALLRPPEKEKRSAIGKFVFVEMARKKQILPDEIIFQKKASPVTAPVDTWYSSSLQQQLFEYVNDAPFKVDKSYLKTVLKPKIMESLIRKRTLGRYLYHPISLIATYSRFFDGK